MEADTSSQIRKKKTYNTIQNKFSALIDYDMVYYEINNSYSLLYLVKLFTFSEFLHQINNYVFGEHEHLSKLVSKQDSSLCRIREEKCRSRLWCFFHLRHKWVIK